MQNCARATALWKEKPGGPSSSCRYASAIRVRLCTSRASQVSRLPNQGLWLSWRLSQWLGLQLATLPDDTRRVAVETLSRAAPDPEPPERCAPRIHDPRAFAPDQFDHRLAAVLFALTRMEAVAFQRKRELQQKEEKVPSFDVHTPALERMLVSLAGRPLTAHEDHLNALTPEELERSA